MTAHFKKKVYNAEDGTRTLGFYLPSNPKPFLTFNLNVLEDLRFEIGDVALARQMAMAIQEFLKVELTPEEIEFAVEDI